MSINKVILVGNVGKDPEVRHFEGGVAKATFTLATSETYVKNGEKITNTEWHNIGMWRGLADVAQKYVKKGMQLYIEGKIQTRSYDDKDGSKKFYTEIIAENMQMLGKKSDDGQTSGVSGANSQSVSVADDTYTPEDPANDLPF